MCLAIPGKVMHIEGETAIVEIAGLKKEVNISLINNLKIDDYVIIHSGCAIEKITDTDFNETIQCFMELYPDLKW